MTPELIYLTRIILCSALIVCNVLAILYIAAHRAAGPEQTAGRIFAVLYGAVSDALLFFSTPRELLIIQIFTGAAICVYLTVLYICRSREVRRRDVALFFVLTAVVCVVTVFGRDVSPSHNRINMDVHTLFTMSGRYLAHFYMNIIMFVPHAYFFARIRKGARCSWFYGLVYGLTFSLIIEGTQTTLGVGQCDIVDLVANTIGAFIGITLARVVGWIEM